MSDPVRMDDDLYIRNIRQCVKRDMPQRPDTGERQHQDSGKDEEPIAGACFDNLRQHHMPPVAFTRSCFVAMVWPFFCAVMVTCHVPPEPSDPPPS
jgi:hypothetical protein